MKLRVLWQLESECLRDSKLKTSEKRGYSFTQKRNNKREEQRKTGKMELEGFP